MRINKIFPGNKWFYTLFSIIFMLFVLFIYAQKERKKEIKNLMEKAVNEGTCNLFHKLDARLGFIANDLSYIYSKAAPQSQIEHQEKMIHLIEAYPFLQAINYLGPDLRVEFVCPFETNQGLIGSMVRSVTAKEALKIAASSKHPYLSTHLDIIQEGKGYSMFVPYPHGGFCEVTFTAEKVFGNYSAFRLRRDILIEVVDDSFPVFTSSEFQEQLDHAREYMLEAKGRVLNRNLYISALPTSDMLANGSKFWRIIATGSLSLFGILFLASVLMQGIDLRQLSYAIDQTKKAQEAHQKSERFLQNIFDTIQDGIVALDKELNIIRNNQIIEKWYSPQIPIIGEKCYKVFHERNKPCDNCPSLKALEKGTPQTGIVSFPGPEGEKNWQEVYSFPILDQTGKSIGTVEHVRNITNRMKTELALRESEERYRNAIEHSNDGVIISKNGVFVYMNRRFIDIFGYDSPQDLIGKSLTSIVHPDDWEKVMNYSFRIEKGELAPDKYEFKGVCKDETSLFIEVSQTLITYRGETVNLAYFRDITERKKIEIELMRSHRLESIGTLAGGIAHDFKNLINVILCNLDLVQMDLTQNEENYSRLDVAKKACMSGNDLTNQFLTFSKGGFTVKNPFPIDKLIKESVNSIIFGSNVNCEFSIPDDSWLVEYDEIQMRQAIENIIYNAIDAMPKGGTIRIKLESIPLDEGQPFMDLVKKSQIYVKISIQDDGIGISHEHIPFIFDPYFSTKQRGAKKGMGLGLTVVHSIIKQHDGFINVESETGSGTAFQIYLPKIVFS
ncbi:MAG: PAS domain S-box protein [bacterium]